MSASYPTLGTLWPYAEAAVPPELASLPLDVFLRPQKGSPVTAANWSTGDIMPGAAPRASYALRFRQAQGEGELSKWDPMAGAWQPVRSFPVPSEDDGCAIVELHGILLGNVTNADALKERMKSLLAPEIKEAKAYRLLSKVLAVASIITLFFAVRSGVESHAPEPFLLIFALAVGIGLLAVGLRARTKVLNDSGTQRLSDQFQFEYRKDKHQSLTLRDVTQGLREHDLRREEEAVMFGFLLLLCFVYFISPLVVVGVIVALILVTLVTSDAARLRLMAVAQDRAETRLETAMLSYRNGHDALAPPALRQAKRAVLRDRMRRYAQITEQSSESTANFRLTQDIGLGVAFLVIFSAYAFPIASGFQRLSISLSDSLVSTSLFSVAPVIILLSISKNTAALAQVVNRRLAQLSK
jgi:hypothetical protein